MRSRAATSQEPPLQARGPATVRAVRAMWEQLRTQAAEAHILAPPANSCVTLGKLLNRPELCFLIYKMGLITITTLKRLRRLNESLWKALGAVPGTLVFSTL